MTKEQDHAARSVREKAREFVARFTERFARNVITPPRTPLVERVLVVVTRWKTDDSSVITDAVEHGKSRAEKGRGGFLSKLFFGTLRFMGFGYMEPTGQGGVKVDRDEDAVGVYVVTTMIGVRVEEDGAIDVEDLQRRAKKMPAGTISALTGIRPGKAKLVDIKVEIQ